VHPLAGLDYVATCCGASSGWSERLFEVRQRVVTGDGQSTVTVLASPSGNVGQTHTGSIELVAEQGDALIMCMEGSVDGVPTTAFLTLHSSSVGELFSTDGTDWVRCSVAVRSLPAVAHEH
jgi:hypothetical protein